LPSHQTQPEFGLSKHCAAAFVIAVASISL
jgi:hypothetical protein